MEEADKDWMMIRMVGGWMFPLVPVHPGTPGQSAVKWLLLCVVVFVATSNIPLSTPDHVSNAASPSGSTLRPVPSSHSAPQSPSQSKLDSLRAWSFNTYKFTRQLLSERLGRGTRTIDSELEAQIEVLRDTQAKYANILRLARALTAHFYQVSPC